jgi:hypothetical protein
MSIVLCYAFRSARDSLITLQYIHSIYMPSLGRNQKYSACYSAETAHATKLNQLVHQSSKQALRD